MHLMHHKHIRNFFWVCICPDYFFSPAPPLSMPRFLSTLEQSAQPVPLNKQIYLTTIKVHGMIATLLNNSSK